jgi:Xaa-Pro aminopeptidase
MIDINRPVPHFVLRQRLASMQAWMGINGLHALVVFAQGSALAMATKSHGNLRYLVDWDGDNMPTALILPASGAPALVAGNIFQRFYAAENGLFREVRLGRGAAFAKAILALLPADVSRIGLVGREEMPVAIWENLGAGDWIDCTGEFSRRRLIKDDVQIAYHRDTAAICDEMFDRLGSELRSGKPVFQIQLALEYFARERGCEVARTWLTVAPVADRCRFWRDENRHVPAAGDQVLFGIMLLKHGHWGHAIRSGAMGEAGRPAREVFEVVQRMHTGMIERLQPGAELGQVDQVRIAERDRYRDGCGGRALFEFRAGHTLGHSYEDPIGTAEFPQPYDPNDIPPATPRLIEAGMLFEVHPNLFVEGFAAASIGDMVLIGNAGPAILTQWPAGLARW